MELSNADPRSKRTVIITTVAQARTAPISPVHEACIEQFVELLI